MYFSDGGHETKQFGLIAHGLYVACSPLVGSHLCIEDVSSSYIVIYNSNDEDL